MNLRKTQSSPTRIFESSNLWNSEMLLRKKVQRTQHWILDIMFLCECISRCENRVLSECLEKISMKVAWNESSFILNEDGTSRFYSLEFMQHEIFSEHSEKTRFSHLCISSSVLLSRLTWCASSEFSTSTVSESTMRWGAGHLKQ